MNVERERVDDVVVFRWVVGPCGDPYCRDRRHLYCMMDVAARDRWFLSAVLAPDEDDRCGQVEDLLLNDDGLLSRATVMAVLWGCPWRGMDPRQIQLQLLTSRGLDPHANDLIDAMTPAEAGRLRELCKGGVYPALLDMMGAYVADVGGTRREGLGSDEGEDGVG